MIKEAIAAISVLLAGCGATAPTHTRRTQDQFTETHMPPEPTRPEGGVLTSPVRTCVGVGDDNLGPGILFSDDTAAYVGRLRVSYDELRGLYLVDQRTWSRERGVYERHLELADDEIDRSNQRAQRSFWEMHGDEIGLVGGFIVGVAVTIGIVAAVENVR